MMRATGDLDNDSMLYPIDGEMTSQTDSQMRVQAQLSSDELLRRFQEQSGINFHRHGRGAQQQQHQQEHQQQDGAASGESGNSPGVELPRLGSFGSHADAGVRSPGQANPNGVNFVGDSPALRPTWVEIGDPNHVESLSSNTVVLLTSKHSGGPHSGSSSVLPTPSGAHSGKTKVFVYDGEALEEHRLAREWRSHHHLSTDQEALPVSHNGSTRSRSIAGSGEPTPAGVHMSPLEAMKRDLPLPGGGAPAESESGDDEDSASKSTSLSHELYGQHPSARRVSVAPR